MAIVVAIGASLFNLLCVGLTLLQMPGLWLMLLAALCLNLFYAPSMFSWWTIGAAGGLCLLAEVSEFAAGAVGAQRAGATRRGMWGAVAGGIVGAIVGTVAIPIPVLGTLLGAGIGSGLGAAGLELSRRGATMDHAARVAGGAAVGRVTAAVIKLGFACVLAAVLSVAAFID